MRHLRRGEGEEETFAWWGTPQPLHPIILQAACKPSTTVQVRHAFAVAVVALRRPDLTGAEQVLCPLVPAETTEFEGLDAGEGGSVSQDSIDSRSRGGTIRSGRARGPGS